MRSRAVVSATPVRIGVSSCLLGNAVRYDGGHKRDAWLVDTLGRYVEWVPVCPEVEIGLGTPRPTLRLEGRGDHLRLMMPSTGGDYTDAMRQYAQARVAALARRKLCGYVLKKNSPSCGMQRVKVYGAKTKPRRIGRGLFADALLGRLPNLPVEEEGRLNDPTIRGHFIARVFAYHRVRTLFAARWTPRDLIAFHSAHRLQLMVHAPARYRALDQLVANAKTLSRTLVRTRYEADFMRALAVRATTARHANMLRHLVDQFGSELNPIARRTLLRVIDDYSRALISLVVPLTLIRDYIRQFGVTSLSAQTYLAPHPIELLHEVAGAPQTGDARGLARKAGFEP
ncbi:MAG: DUF1722 domain-containing protein [Deltaproteobacteria bacterium]|nr:DUF1722 domain-containing protein [Deltaproteobacteria bacterium]MBI3388242.1 DUF1722 domain-containing protein [Deltaproteobacteria bacterium]